MESKRGRFAQDDDADSRHAFKKVVVNRSLTADEEEMVVRDLRDGVFGKSVYCSDTCTWAVDDRDSGRPFASSDLARLCTVAEAYGWFEQEDLLRQACGRAPRLSLSLSLSLFLFLSLFLSLSLSLLLLTYCPAGVAPDLLVE
jgi:hypothetical protein